MAADRYGEMVSDLRSFLLAGLTPIEQMASVPKSLLQGIDRDIADYDELKRQNEILKTEVLLLKAKQQQLINLKQEVSRLESLLGTTGKITNHNVQIATVTQFSNNPISQFMTLNKGTNDGVAVQDTVIDANGIVGQIVNTTPFSSRVMLITDPEHQLPVRVQRTSQRGILTGSGYDGTELDFIPKNSNIKVGDIIESSGLGGVFPAGYPVATVNQVTASENAPYLQISTQPISDLHKAHKVLILKPEQIRADEINTKLEYDVNQTNAMEPISNSSTNLTKPTAEKTP